jgi:hypothetical protein
LTLFSLDLPWNASARPVEIRVEITPAVTRSSIIALLKIKESFVELGFNFRSESVHLRDNETIVCLVRKLAAISLVVESEEGHCHARFTRIDSQPPRIGPRLHRVPDIHDRSDEHHALAGFILGGSRQVA